MDSGTSMKTIELNKKEVEVLMGLIQDYQWDGCEYTINSVDLTTLKRKIKKWLK